MSNYVACKNGPVHHKGGVNWLGSKTYDCGMVYFKEDKPVRTRVTCKNCLRARKHRGQTRIKHEKA